MSILQLDGAQAHKIFSTRPPVANEISILMLFKTPVDVDRLLGEEFEQVLDNGENDRQQVRKIIETLLNEKVLVPLEIEETSTVNSNDLARAELSSRLSSLGRLMQSVSGDLVAMGQWAEKEVRIEGQQPSEYINSIRDQLSHLRKELTQAKTLFITEQLNSLEKTNEARLNLHLGSGSSCPKGWTNIDMVAGDMRMNLCWDLPFADDSINFVYSAHTFEHLDYHTSAPRLLREIFRVLKPGAVVRMAVPDMGAYSEAYVNKKSAFFAEYDQARPEFGSPAGYVTPMSKVMMMAGSASRPANWFEHKMGYDFETLSSMFIAAGYSSCDRSYFEASEYPLLKDIDSYSKVTGQEFSSVENSLFVEAKK